MKRFKISWRMGLDAVQDPKACTELLDLMTAEGQAGDEFWIFLSEPSSFCYEPLESIRRKCEAWKIPAAAARARGIRVGINPWPTFGAEESYQTAFPPDPMPFPTMVGYDGSVAKRVACPVSKEFLSYTKARYKLFAEAGCSFVWVDDDCRFTHLGGVPYPCFCPTCVKGFDDGKWPDRETLVSALNAPENGELRRKWCAYGADRLARYCSAVREAVDEVDPSIETPFMSVGYSHTSFSGDYIEKCMKALRAKGARPGHGFYWDETPMELFDKVYEMSRQIVNMPAEVLNDVQYEEESCPCTPLNKAPETRIREIGLAIWGGCTGMAMNHLYNAGGQHPFGWLRPERDMLLAFRPIADRYLDFSHDLPQSGIWAAYSEWAASATDVREKGWFNETDPIYSSKRFVHEWPCFGTAVTADPRGAYASLLQGRAAAALSDAELRELFNKPVFLDGEAVKMLWERGLGELTGVKVIAQGHGGAEKLAVSPYASAYAGSCHSALFDFAYELEPVVDGVEPLAYTVRPYGAPEELAATRFGNAVVLGYDPYQYTGTPGRRALINGLEKALGAPVILDPVDPDLPPRVALFARSDSHRAAALLINGQIGRPAPFDLCFRGTVSSAELLYTDGQSETVPVRHEGEWSKVRFDTMEPWEMKIILLK